MDWLCKTTTNPWSPFVQLKKRNKEYFTWLYQSFVSYFFYIYIPDPQNVLTGSQYNKPFTSGHERRQVYDNCSLRIHCNLPLVFKIVDFLLYTSILETLFILSVHILSILLVRISASYTFKSVLHSLFRYICPTTL